MCRPAHVPIPGSRTKRAAKSTTICQSGLACPGGATAARTLVILRSLLVTVPSFSPQVAAGSNRSANSQVSDVAKASCTTTNSARSRARRTAFWLGIDWAGFVQAIHSILISPSAAASNISTAVLPGFLGTSSMPQRSATSWR